MGVRGTGLPATMRELLERGGTILTANARASRALHSRYAEAQEGAAWPTPRILDLHSWLTEQWTALLLTGTEDRLLLNELQEHVLWQRIIRPGIANFSLIEPAHMATLAAHAYALLADYGALGKLNTAWMPDSIAEPEVFRQWARNFQGECTRNRWLPGCELIDAIAAALRWGSLPAPEEIGWLGFDSETPAITTLMSALAARGTGQQRLSWSIAQAASPRLFSAPSEQDENAACAAWVRARLKADAGARIGILMPDLASRRVRLERELYEQLSPDQFPISAGTAPSLPFEFSLGQPLAELSLVHAALLLLRWLEQRLPQQEISWLLLSSTLHAGQGETARDDLAHLDAQLRNARCAPFDMTLEAFLRSSRTGASAPGALRRNLDAMQQEHRRNSRPASAGEWIRRINRLLSLAGWGARTDASSLLYQAREAWHSLLDQVASLDFAHVTYSYQELLTILERAAEDTIFAPASEGAPVQVMGAYAAAGQSFDAVWFLGATDTGWPIAGHPHPLLPISLQRELGMPHSSPAEDTALAHRMMQRIADGCGEIMYSCARMAGDALQRPSSLVEEFAPADVASAAGERRIIACDTIPDATWVPIDHADVVSGGQKALKRQADCPFQAFVFHRLHVHELSMAGRGLSPAERGNVLHRLMQGIWSEDIEGHVHLSGHGDLVRTIADGTLRPLVAAHAAAVIRKMRMMPEEPWQRAYMDAEEERAIDLAMDWLAVEAARQPFEVASVEQKIDITVGELALRVRADRIDRVAGGELLIDYKTGEVSTASWEGPRPEQPQLPLYAAFGGSTNLVGAVFAQVRRPKLLFKGRVDDPRTNLMDTLEAKDPLLTAAYTPELVEEWRSTLLNLSENFLRGVAEIDPNIYPRSCQYCPLHGVCRIAESRGAGSTADELNDEETA